MRIGSKKEMEWTRTREMQGRREERNRWIQGSHSRSCRGSCCFEKSGRDGEQRRRCASRSSEKMSWSQFRQTTVFARLARG
eukprot:3249915-Rhodomonas_salina.1